MGSRELSSRPAASDAEDDSNNGEEVKMVHADAGISMVFARSVNMVVHNK